MECYRCSQELIWQSDFSFEDYDFEGDGIVTVLICPGCGSIIEITTSFSSGNEIN